VKTLLRNIATLGPIGYVPIAPGTFGSLAAMICLWLRPLAIEMHLTVIVLGTVVGTLAAASAQNQFGEKDSRKIIVDEFVGYFVAAVLIPTTPALLIASFFLFRFFDILKPLMIKKIENTLRNGFGVMADDLIAGIYANISLRIILFLVS
jgi:phosphatidylglycerophosphatase A